MEPTTGHKYPGLTELYQYLPTDGNLRLKTRRGQILSALPDSNKETTSWTWMVLCLENRNGVYCRCWEGMHCVCLKSVSYARLPQYSFKAGGTKWILKGKLSPSHEKRGFLHSILNIFIYIVYIKRYSSTEQCTWLYAIVCSSVLWTKQQVR